MRKRVRYHSRYSKDKTCIWADWFDKSCAQLETAAVKKVKKIKVPDTDSIEENERNNKGGSP